MHIRLARPQDRKQLLSLWERSARATHHFLQAGDIEKLRPLVAEELASNALDWWVMVSADQVLVGFLGYTKNTIEALFVDPSHQRQGVGKFLVAHAQNLANGVLTVDVNEQNEAALQFYKVLGFFVVGRSATDGDGRPYPLLHMKRMASQSAKA